MPQGSLAPKFWNHEAKSARNNVWGEEKKTALRGTVISLQENKEQMGGWSRRKPCSGGKKKYAVATRGPRSKVLVQGLNKRGGGVREKCRVQS